MWVKVHRSTCALEIAGMCVCVCGVRFYFVRFAIANRMRCAGFAILRVISLAKTKNGHNEINMYPTITIEKFTIVEQSTVLVIFFFFAVAVCLASPLLSFAPIHSFIVDLYGSALLFFHGFIRFIIYVPGYLFSFSCGFFPCWSCLLCFLFILFSHSFRFSIRTICLCYNFSHVCVCVRVFFSVHFLFVAIFYGKHCAIPIYTQR